MSLQPKLLQSPKYRQIQRKISLFNESINMRSTRNQSFDQRRPSNGRFRGSGSVIKGAKASDYHGNILVLHQNVQFLLTRIQEAIRCFQDCINIDPMHLQSRYMIGICAFSLQQYDKSLRELKMVKEMQPKFNKNLYLIMSLIFKKQNQLSQGIQILEEGLNAFEFYDGYIFKGKLELKMKRIADAENSFKYAISLNDKKSAAYQFLGDLYRGQNQLELALRNYSIAVQLEDIPQNYLKLTVCLYEMQEYHQANQLIDRFLKNLNSSEGFKLKGQILQKLDQRSESQLYFESAIRANNSKPAVTRAMIEIVKYKLEQRDFYSLQHVLSRAEFIDIDYVQLQPYISFTEGVVQLMKRKHQEALALLLSITEMTPCIRDVYLHYRGYCYMMLGFYEKALEDFESTNSYPYNQAICQGILHFDNYQLALQSFITAGKIQPGDAEIYIFLLHLKHQVEIEKSLQIDIDQAQVYYLKTLGLTYLRKFKEALQMITLTIEKHEDNCADHYYLKGIIEAQLGDMTSAIQDFTLSYNLNQNIKSLLQRAKCYSNLQELQYAFDDMQAYVAQIDDYFAAGNLLFNNGSFEEALKTYEQDKNQTPAHESVIIKCLLQLKEFEKLKKYKLSEPDLQALQAYELMMAYKYQDSLNILNAIKQKGQLFSKADISIYRGICLMYIGKLYEAIQEFEKGIKSTKQETTKLIITYNISLCWAFQSKFKYALTLQQQLFESSEQQDLFITLRSLLEAQTIFSLSQTPSGEELILTSSETLQPFVSADKNYSLYPFVALPQPEMIMMIPDFEESYFKQLDPSVVELRPQAPWIRRNEAGVRFTDTLYTTISNLSDS